MQTTANGQATASSTPVAKYYSPQVKEKLAASSHPANPSATLPGDSKELPKRAKDLAEDGKSHGRDPNGKLPGEAAVNANDVKERNEKWIEKASKSRNKN
jgi:hypothetical protein